MLTLTNCQQNKKIKLKIIKTLLSQVKNYKTTFVFTLLHVFQISYKLFLDFSFNFTFLLISNEQVFKLIEKSRLVNSIVLIIHYKYSEVSDHAKIIWMFAAKHQIYNHHPRRHQSIESDAANDIPKESVSESPARPIMRPNSANFHGQ